MTQHQNLHSGTIEEAATATAATLATRQRAIELAAKKCPRKSTTTSFNHKVPFNVHNSTEI